MEDPTDISKSSGCTFCEIGSLHPPSEPLQPPKENPKSMSHVILSTPRAIAFLDIFPLSHCHILLCPRRHAEKVTDLTARENADVAGWLPLLARAATKVSGYPEFNIIQNNGVHAAQVVPHVHYHIVPRPNIDQRRVLEEKIPEEHKSYWHKSPFGCGWRVELMDEDGEKMAAQLREALYAEIAATDEKGKSFLANL